MRIGHIARLAQCRAETVRYYEREGLLPMPGRTSGNYRSYGKAHVDRLLFIRRCRSLDMTLSEIRLLLSLRDAPGRDCAEVSRLLDEHLKRVAVRLEQLASLQAELKRLRRRCAGPRKARECGILRELDSCVA